MKLLVYDLKISAGIFVVLFKDVSKLVGRLYLKARISYKLYLATKTQYTKSDVVYKFGVDYGVNPFMEDVLDTLL